MIIDYMKTLKADRQTLKQTIKPDVLLESACYVNDLSLLKHSLKHGANPNNARALKSVAIRGYAKLMDLLLINGADPNTPRLMEFAQSFKQTEIKRLLLYHGARIN